MLSSAERIFNPFGAPSTVSAVERVAERNLCLEMPARRGLAQQRERAPRARAVPHRERQQRQSVDAACAH